MTRLLALLLAAALVAGCGASDPESRTPERLPDVSLPSLTGGSAVDLGELRGPAVVNLWAQWCVPCKRELPIYESFFARHGSQVAVLGDDWLYTKADRARRLARKSGVTYPLVVDSEPAIRGQYLPKLILVDPHGRIAFQEYVEVKSLDQLEGLVEKHLDVTL